MRFRLTQVEIGSPIQQHTMVTGQQYFSQPRTTITGTVQAEEEDLKEVQRIMQHGIDLVPEDMAIAPDILRNAIEMSLHELTNIRGLLQKKTGETFYSLLPKLEYRNDGDSVSVLKILLAISSDIDNIKTILNNDKNA